MKSFCIETGKYNLRIEYFIFVVLKSCIEQQSVVSCSNPYSVLQSRLESTSKGLCIFPIRKGAMSDLNSMFDGGGILGREDRIRGDHHYDDDTSVSSRASSRMFDSDMPVVGYDSEYDNYMSSHPSRRANKRHYGGGGGMTSDEDVLRDGASDLDVDNMDMDLEVPDYADEFNLQSIRSVSQSITNNFGNGASMDYDEHDDLEPRRTSQENLVDGETDPKNQNLEERVELDNGREEVGESDAWRWKLSNFVLPFPCHLSFC